MSTEIEPVIPPTEELDVDEPRKPSLRNPSDPAAKTSTRTSFSKPDDPATKRTPQPSVDPPSPLPPKSPSSKVNFHRPQAGQPISPANKPSMQRQMSQALNRASRYMPPFRQGEAWMYAAAFVAFYTLVMLFRMSTFGFICVMIYTAMITLLVLSYFGLGPLVTVHTRITPF